MNDKIEASLMLASYFETLGFKNGLWEFNYNHDVHSLNDYNFISNTMLHHFTILGGTFNISLKNWISSDDTILILATAQALLLNDNNKYIIKYCEYFEKLKETNRISGINTLFMINLLKKGYTLDSKSDMVLPEKANMGGNGAAMRTGPIGLFYHNDYEKVIIESMVASRLTHNYYLGFMGGVITALFTAFAFNNIPPWKWIDELFLQYDTIVKHYPTSHKMHHLDRYMNYWKKYNESIVQKIKFKNSLDIFIYPKNRLSYLVSYHPDNNSQDSSIKFDWSKLGATGLDVCIYAYDCLLLSMYTPNSELLDFDNIKYNINTFITLVCIHPGDNDTTAAIGGTWYGAINGYDNFDKNRLQELEFYNELLIISNQLKKKLIR